MKLRVPYILLNVLLCLSICVKADSLKLGMSAPFSGPAKELGEHLKFGADLYLKQYNQTAQGRKIPVSIIAKDDGYEPQKTLENTRKFLSDDSIFGLINYVGTPTSKVIMPLLVRQNKLYLTPFTGAEFLRNPVTPYIFNIRSSYYLEAEKQVSYFVDTKGLKKTAIFFQADAFGLSASQGFINALKKRNIQQLEKVRYQRNTINIERAVEKFKQSQPDVIFSIGTYEPLALLANRLREEGVRSTIVFLSFVAAEPLRQRLSNFDNIYITSALMNPMNSTLPIATAYRKAIGERVPDHVSFEGYLNMAFLTAVLHRIEGEITEKKFIEAAEQGPLSVGGISLNYSETNHQGLYEAFLYQITRSGLVSVKE